MNKAITHTLLEYTRRMFACVMLLFCVMPVAEAEATTRALSEEMWANTGFCLADAPEAQTGVMTPDARAYQMSIELRALREMLRTQSEEDLSSRASVAPAAPCEVDEESPAVCPEPVLDAGHTDTHTMPGFVAASLLEDIAPLDTPEPARSCNASSSGPDRCESYPAHPHRLHIDVTFSSAVLPRALTAHVRPDDKPRTLPLVRALPRHLLGAASGHTLDLERPPQHA